jgi:uncharacterized membrane protein YdbT with pleckstrin-like domain
MKTQLHDDEKVLFEGKPQQSVAWYWVLSRLWHVIILLVIFFLMVYFNPGQRQVMEKMEQGLFHQSLAWGHILPVIIIAIVVVGYFWFRKVSQGYDYVITDQRSILHYGFISLNRRVIPHNQVVDVNIRATLFERLFGLGSVYIDGIGTMGSQMMMGSRRSANNTTRLEGLKLEQCEQVMDLLSKVISTKKH